MKDATREKREEMETAIYNYNLSLSKEPSFKNRPPEVLKDLPTYVYLLAFLSHEENVCTKVGASVKPSSRILDYQRTKALRKQKFRIYATVLCKDRPTALALEKMLCSKFRKYRGKEYLESRPENVMRKMMKLMALPEFDIGMEMISLKNPKEFDFDNDE